MCPYAPSLHNIRAILQWLAAAEAGAELAAFKANAAAYAAKQPILPRKGERNILVSTAPAGPFLSATADNLDCAFVKAVLVSPATLHHALAMQQTHSTLMQLIDPEPKASLFTAHSCCDGQLTALLSMPAKDSTVLRHQAYTALIALPITHAFHGGPEARINCNECIVQRGRNH